VRKKKPSPVGEGRAGVQKEDGQATASWLMARRATGKDTAAVS